MFTQVRALLTGSQGNHSVRLVGVAEGREDAVADAEVGVAVVGTFNRAFEPERNSTESSCRHCTAGTRSTPGIYSRTATGSSSGSRFVISACSICSPVAPDTPREKLTDGRNSVASRPAAETIAPATKTR